jgi:lysine 2,3-aminomutase
LNGINNHAAMVAALSRRLLYLRVKPYYMFQCDPSQGTEHFRTSLAESLGIARELWGKLSGLATPVLSMDIPGGGGKFQMSPTQAEPEMPAVGFDGFQGDYVPPQGPRREPMDLHLYLPEWTQIVQQRYGT